MQTEWRFLCHLCNAIKRKKRDMWSIAGHLKWTLNEYYNQPSSTLICYVTLDSDPRNVFIRDFTAELHQTYFPSDTENIRGLYHYRESISTPGPCQCESHKSGHSWIDPYLTQRFSKVSKGWAVKQELIGEKSFLRVVNGEHVEPECSCAWHNLYKQLIPDFQRSL